MAIEITDEMRKAVLAEMCTTNGHQMSMAEAIRPESGNRYVVRSSDPNKLPHLSCSRCGLTWLVLDDPSADYEEAEERLRSKLKDTTEIDELRKKRKAGKD